MHRLRSAGTEIDDGEPALAQHRAAFGLDPDGTRVRPAMPHRLDHGFTDRAQRIGRCRRAPIDHASNAAHRASSDSEDNFTLKFFRLFAQALIGCLVEERYLPLSDLRMRPIVIDPYHLTPRLIRDSPDESQTGINVRVSPALLQDRHEVLTATSTSGHPNACSRV